MLRVRHPRRNTAIRYTMETNQAIKTVFFREFLMIFCFSWNINYLWLPYMPPSSPTGISVLRCWPRTCKFPTSRDSPPATLNLDRWNGETVKKNMKHVPHKSSGNNGCFLFNYNFWENVKVNWNLDRSVNFMVKNVKYWRYVLRIYL